MMITAILPILAWIGCFRLFRRMAAREWIDGDWRFTAILATTAWGALVTIITEALSLASALNAPAVQVCWAVADVFLWLVVPRLVPVISEPASATSWRELWETIQQWPLDARLIAGAVAVLVLVLGEIALLTPTTNWDSMTYHLPRVMHWIQNGSVAHYPTNMEGQNQMGPWSGFVQTHLWLLWGGDRLANMVQWLALIQNALTASLLVRQLRATAGPRCVRTEVFAALLVVTLPIGIVESITTQTDLTTSVWLLGLASLALAYWRQPENRIYAAALGAAVGLGVLTKITFVIFSLPLIVVAAVAIIWRARKRVLQLAAPSVLALAFCLALALPHVLRNQRTFGSAVGSRGSMQGHGVAHVTINGVVCNMIRNLSLHNNTGLPSLTRTLNAITSTAQRWTGRPLNDPDWSAYQGKAQNPPEELLIFDSIAACPWHVALIGVASVVALMGLRRDWFHLVAAAVPFAGFALFCSLIRWEPWNSRYHLPLLNLFAPVVAVALGRHLPRWGIALVSAGLMAFAAVVVTHNQSRPVFVAEWRDLPRASQMLACHGRRYDEPMRAVVWLIMATRCQSVGLKIGGDDPEYPLWVLLREAGFKGTIRHQYVTGPSARLAKDEPPPDVLITTQTSLPDGPDQKLFPQREDLAMFALHWSADAGKRRSQLKQ